VLLCVAGVLAGSARAADPFEIQVYDGTANPPGVFGLELHTNYVASGLKTATAPLLPADRQLHLTLEPSYGLLEILELGGYLQGVRRSDGSYDFGGAKLRAKLVAPSVAEHLRLGVNFEVSLLPRSYDPNRWGGEIRPIIAFEDDRFLLAANPILGLTFDGSAPGFEPAAMAKLKLFDTVAAGLEWYSGVGTLAGLLPLREQEQYLYEAVDLIGFKRFELNFGVGEGLTAGSNPLVIKLILGWTFESAGR
jgi:hypothetical protein